MYTGEFTKHALGHILERASPYAVRRSDNDRPLLDELNNYGYIKIKQLVKETFPQCNISQIRQVYAPQMYGMYMLRHEEMKKTIRQISYGRIQEKWLYHVTTESRAMESLNSGLDWRRTHRNKYGRGVSFSDDADYANFYADNFITEETRVIMICSVLVCEPYVVPEQNDGNNLIVPPGNTDTTMSHNRRVYVKYNDYEFYPLYFVYYRNRPELLTKSKYFRANTQYNRRTLEEMCSDHLDATRHYDDDDTFEQMCSDFHDGIYNHDKNYDQDYHKSELYGDDLYADYFDD